MKIIKFINICNIEAYFRVFSKVYKSIYRTANKYYSSAGHHEQKNKKTGQIKFLAVTKRQIKLVLQHSLYK